MWHKWNQVWRLSKQKDEGFFFLSENAATEKDSNSITIKTEAKKLFTLE